MTNIAIWQQRLMRTKPSCAGLLMVLAPRWQRNFPHLAVPRRTSVS